MFAGKSSLTTRKLTILSILILSSGQGQRSGHRSGPAGPVQSSKTFTWVCAIQYTLNLVCHPPPNQQIVLKLQMISNNYCMNSNNNLLAWQSGCLRGTWRGTCCQAQVRSGPVQFTIQLKFNFLELDS